MSIFEADNINYYTRTQHKDEHIVNYIPSSNIFHLKNRHDITNLLLKVALNTKTSIKEYNTFFLNYINLYY